MTEAQIIPMTDLRKLAEGPDPVQLFSDKIRCRKDQAEECECSFGDVDTLAVAMDVLMQCGWQPADTSAAKDAEIARLREAFDPDRIHAQTIEAMTDAWNDICADTGCHPLDIERKGRELTFSPRHWADQTATWLIVKLCGETESDEATKQGGNA